MKTDRIEQTTELATGVVVYENYFRERERHRLATEGPALIHRDPRTGAVLAEAYLEEGKRHRTDGPAVIERNASGAIIREVYCVKGVLHRDPLEGPALIERKSPHNPDQITRAEYYVILIR
ncbi:hypothetical protein NLM33_41745 [Bradyrhizobium sp. CCGUVB1N3]|uniref:hypothetical protein n=1 Tax=Bradyrhizobium sp. CCGUVB1N3 TaxID=2949629 RepID=UPI0020B3063A|nr:hypothetical protein [Bradyrhizobium sp. CCGUVB1N3]MCP3476690.1 hypothetical protein [Bradyrhizobium sp. CCGUVB1N3]